MLTMLKGPVAVVNDNYYCSTTYDWLIADLVLPVSASEDMLKRIAPQER